MPQDGSFISYDKNNTNYNYDELITQLPSDWKFIKYLIDE